MSFSLKQFMTIFVLAAFLALALFSFTALLHGSNNGMGMESGCPFSTPNGLVCPQNTLATAIHHISAFSAFLNVPVGVNMTILFAFLFLVAGAVATLFMSPPSAIFSKLTTNFYDSPPTTSSETKTKRWLSLFENSPSRL